MITAIWEFLKDPENRSVLAWIGAGACVVAAGLWKIVGERRAKSGSVTSINGSIGIIGNVQDSQLSASSTQMRQKDQRSDTGQ